MATGCPGLCHFIGDNRNAPVSQHQDKREKSFDVFRQFRIGGIEIKNKNRRCHAELSNLGLEFDILGQNQKRATGGTMKETLYSCGFD
jgi:hypothetical protein